MFKFFAKFFILIALLCLAAGFYYDFQISSALDSQANPQLFEVKEGSSVKVIAQQLADRNLIRSKKFFELYVWFKDLQKDFQPGGFSLSASMNIKDIVGLLTNQNQNELQITIIEGKNSKEIASYLESQGLTDQEEFLALVNNPPTELVSYYSFLETKPVGASLEGFLFPDTYRVFKKSDPLDILKKLLDNFQIRFDQNLIKQADDNNQSIYEIITLASIVEKEVSKVDDMAMVADIFLKRLEAGIALQSDATINFITSKGQVQPSLDDLKVESPYNTYLNPGLPPGPIGNPGLSAIKAVINPTANDYYYFLTTKEGKVIYAKNYQEHLANKRQYLE